MSSSIPLKPEAVAIVACRTTSRRSSSSWRRCSPQVYGLDAARCSSSSRSASSSAAPASVAASRSPMRAIAGHQPAGRRVARAAPRRSISPRRTALPVDLVFGLLSPENSGATHLHALAAISRLMRDERMHEALSRSARCRGALRPAEQCHRPRRCLKPRAGRRATAPAPLARAGRALCLGAGQRLFQSRLKIPGEGRSRIEFDVDESASTPPARRTARSISRCSTMRRSMRPIRWSPTASC